MAGDPRFIGLIGTWTFNGDRRDDKQRKRTDYEVQLFRKLHKTISREEVQKELGYNDFEFDIAYVHFLGEKWVCYSYLS